jgi:ribosomal protein S18 acetylase RimI-like enzyme
VTAGVDCIRGGRSSDVDALVDLHYRVFDERTHLAMLFGRAFVRAAYRWYSESRDAFTLVAEMNGRLEGSCTVNRGSYYVVFLKNGPALARAVLSKPGLVLEKAIWRRLLALRARRLSNAGDRAYLAYLAVSPTGRETGIGKGLIAAAIVECRRRGWDEMITAIHRDNVPARFMYRTLGFEEFSQLSHDDLVGIRLRTTSPKI